MGQLPKDPQQLAQDIIAGRVSIRQLQAEQARRRAAQEALQRNMSTRPKPPSTPGRQPVRQVVKSAGPLSRQPRRQARSYMDPTSPTPSTPKKTSQVRPATSQSLAASDARPSDSSAATKSPAPAVKAAATPRTAAQTVRAVMNNPHALRSVFVLSELLDKPLSLRQDPLDRF